MTDDPLVLVRVRQSQYSRCALMVSNLSGVDPLSTAAALRVVLNKGLAAVEAEANRATGQTVLPDAEEGTVLAVTRRDGSTYPMTLRSFGWTADHSWGSEYGSVGSELEHGQTWRLESPRDGDKS